MVKIFNNINTFVQELRNGNSFGVTPEGDFYVTNLLIETLQSLLGLTQSNWVSVSSRFRKALDQLESIPIYFNISESNAIQSENFKKFIEAGEIILQRLESYHSKKVNTEKLLLKRSLIALLYRLEEVNGGLSPSTISKTQLDFIIQAAQAWKATQVVYDETALSPAEISILEKACEYSKFMDLIISNQELRDKFFGWVLREHISVQSFIEYPATQQKIDASDLRGRIGRIGGNLLKVLKVQVPDEAEDTFKKIVTLPFEGRDVSILDDQKYILFRGNYALTIREIFEEFAKKREGTSNLEFMGEGIINWNAFLWGWWDADIQDYHVVDFEQAEWWKQLPVFEILSLKEAREKFGAKLDGRQWNVAATAKRERANLDFEGAHAYSTLSIPIGDGRYAVYPFGKYATKFPPSLIRALLNIGHTSDATVAYPDENVYYTHRQRSSYSFAFNEQQGLAYMESVKRDMLLARAGNLIYQIESENCAKWAHQKIEEVVGPHRIPNVFQMPFLNSEPNGFMKLVFTGIKSLPVRWQDPVTLGIHFMLGGYKGVWIWEEGKQVWKSLTHHPFWNDIVIYHPSMLHKQQELGIIGRSVSEGVTFSKTHIHRSFHNLHHKMVVFGEYVLRTSTKIFRSIIEFFKKILSAEKLVSSLEEQFSISSFYTFEKTNNAKISKIELKLYSFSAHSYGMGNALNKGLPLAFSLNSKISAYVFD